MVDDTNPYESPRTTSKPGGQPEEPQEKSPRRVGWLVLFAAAGAVAGAPILSSLCGRDWLDSTWHSIGAGLGGFAGLGVGFLLTLIGILRNQG